MTSTPEWPEGEPGGTPQIANRPKPWLPGLLGVGAVIAALVAGNAAYAESDGIAVAASGIAAAMALGCWRSKASR